MKLLRSLLILEASAREKVDLREDLGDFNEVVGEALITPNVAETYEEIMGIPPNARMVKEGFICNNLLLISERLCRSNQNIDDEPKNKYQSKYCSYSLRE